MESDGLQLKRAAVFVDRDGTINLDPGYLSDPEELELILNAGEGMWLLKQDGFALVVISNQSGVGRGLITHTQLNGIHKRLEKKLSEKGVQLDGIFWCPHHPDAGCSCRKPSPRLVLNAARELNLEPSASYFVGDKVSDIQTGKNAGLKTILVLTGEGGRNLEGARKLGVDHVAADLLAAARWIISNHKGGKQ